MKEPMIWFRSKEGVVPANMKAQAFYDRMSLGELFEIEGKATRNLKHTKKFFKLVDLVLENSDKFASKEQFMIALKATLGRGEWVQIEGASRPLFIPESISFKSMKQDDFDIFFNDAINAIIRHFVAFDKEDLLIELATA